MAEYDADVIVVGAGGLGSAVAVTLAKAGKSVIMLEAGPDIPNWKVIQNWRSSARKDNSTGIIRGRQTASPKAI